MLKRFTQKLLRYLTGYDAMSLSPDDARFVDDWLLEYGRRVAYSTAGAGAVSYLLGAALGALIIPPPYDLILSIVLALLGLESAAWIVFESVITAKHWKFALYFHTFVTNALTTIGMSIFVHAAFTQDNFNTGHMIVAGCMWAGLGWNLATFTPIIGYSNIPVLLSIFGISALMVYSTHTEDFVALVYVLFLIFITLSGFFVAQLARIRSHALIQKKTTELEQQNQVLRLQAIETEMQVAAQLQANLASPPSEVDDAHHRIRFFHFPYSTLGGDLLLVRDLIDGSQIIAVGDVTGKGIAAAMVVQVVQSLWADQLQNDNFSPQDWLQLVNQTLLAIGEKPGTHTLTLGLIVLQQDQVLYYCAGHIPLYITDKGATPPKVRPIFGFGMPLGIVDSVDISPVKVPLPKLGDYTLLLGSDGILDWQTRKHPSRLLGLIENINEQGGAAIKSHPVDDDKILVAISESKAA
ncbi:MAG: hypothetical protein FJ146_18785 [Deltaproteobacteria bacterium]|nr:hypothetical protein [Deltaproteobacteria bacterium]